MKVPSTAIAAAAALLLTLNTTAQANWKASVFYDLTSTPITVPPPTNYAAPKAAAKPGDARRQRKANRKVRQKPRAQRRTRTAAVKRSRRRPRTAARGGILRGLASYYWQPQRVAAGGWFNPNALTAAHKSLPFGTRVRVTNLRNGRSVVVRINDRGPYIRGRIIDLSRRAATVVGMRNAGVVPVKVDILGRGG